MTERDENAPPRTTLFVRNLPFDINAQKLEEEFSKFGPIKKAFVVKDKDNASRCRGFGYVQFVLQADTDKALKTKLSVGNRDLKCSYANKKPKHERRKKTENDEHNQTENVNSSNEENIPKDQKVSSSQPDKKNKFKNNKQSTDENIQSIKSSTDEKAKSESSSDEKAKSESSTDKKSNHKNNNNNKKEKFIENKNDTSSQNEKNQKSDLQRTLVVSGLTAKVKRKNIRILCEQFGEIENIVYPVSDRAEVTAFVRFKDFKSTIRAVQKIGGQKVKKSNTLSAVLLTKEGKFPSKKVQQKSRLIIRNLSFKCEEQDIRDSFSIFGKLIDVKIPTKTVNNKELKIGCAFVQFDNEINAKTALEKMNLKEIKGRPVVVDWAIEKDQYQSQKKEKEALPNTNGNLNPEIKEKVKNDLKANKKTFKDFEGNAAKAKTQEDFIQEDGIQEESIQEDDESFHDDSNNDNDDIDDDDNENELDEDELDEDDDDVDEEKVILPKKQLKDAKEGKTVFIRNLSYNTNEEEIEEEFEKFGEIEYCKLVVDQQTGSSRGSAFVKFKEVDSAETCIKHTSSENQNVFIDGRALVVSLAVTKGKVNEIVREKMDAKKETDKRNLYLAYEGMITRNSPAAEGLSDADLKKREKALVEKKTKLKNPNYFVSRTRLSVRNLPLNINSIELREAFLKVVKNDDIKIANVKIMTSKDRNDSKGMPRSLGFGFLDVGDHEHALAILRATNNNPDLFGKNRRPIVEFAIENAKAIKIQELKQKKIAEMQTKTEDPVNKKSDRQKQREKKFKRIERYHRKREAKRLEKMKSGLIESKSSLPESGEKASSNVSLLKKDVADLLNKNDTSTKKQKKSKVNNDSNIVLPKNLPMNEQGKFNVKKLRRNDEENLNPSVKKSRRNDEVNSNPFVKNSNRIEKGKNSGLIKKPHQNDEDKFNALVNKYKNKIILNDNDNEPNAKKKWFE